MAMTEEVTFNWRDHAQCRGQTHNFYPDPSDELMIARAMSICFQCTVRPICAADAQRRGEAFGIWGGELLDVKVKRRNKRECTRCWSTDLMRWEGLIECISCGFRWAG